MRCGLRGGGGGGGGGGQQTRGRGRGRHYTVEPPSDEIKQFSLL